MNIDINNINYLDYGKDIKGQIVLLHGWGQNIQMMDMLGKPFQNNFRIINIDLPGFGESIEPKVASSVEDYGDSIHKLLEKLNVKNPIIIGHSFGGRIAIYYASKYKCKKVVLLSSPYKPEISKKSFKVNFYKFVKKIKLLQPLANYLKKKWGSADYNNASEINRGTLVKVVNEDLTEYAKKIEVPVLLIYGDKDDVVPIERAYELEKLIKDAGVVVYPGLKHYAYLDNLNQTITVLDSFIK